MKNKLLLLLPLMLFLVLAYFLNKAISIDPRELPSALVGKQLPEFQLAPLDDPLGTLERKDLIGEPFLLNVWASWCPACATEHGYLESLSQQGIKIVGLNYKDTRPDAAKFLSHLGNPFQVIIFDEAGDLGLDLGVYGAPETYLVDAKGFILTKRVGVMDERVWQGQFEALAKKAGLSTSQLDGVGLVE